MKHLFTIFALLAILGMAFIHYGCSSGSDTSAQTNDGSDMSIPVEVSTVQKGDIAAYFTGTATLEAEEETEVVAKVGGTVEKILVEESDHVSANDILTRLDDEKLAVQLQQAKANLQKLENEFQRSEKLYKKNLISAEEFQRSKYEYEHQKAVFDLAKLNLQYTSIRAPISGVIAERFIKVGNMVLTNQPTFRITCLDPLLAVLHVPERQIGMLRKDHAANLKVDAIPEGIFNGHIERISPVVDPATGTGKVTVEVKDPSGRLKPGMFARVHIIHNVHTNTLLVPKDAIMAEDKESSVFVVRDSMAFRQVIQTGYINTTHIEVLKGLSPGDVVVTTGKGSLKDSTRVALVSPLSEMIAGKQ